MPRSHSSPLRRANSMGSRGSRQNSISSIDTVLVDDNNYEMFSGATSEIIPSSISSFHYPHHFGSRHASDASVLRETSPLLSSSHEPSNDLNLRTISSNATSASAETSGGFRFFSPDDIERAPGGSTLENPEDPVDYNTNWDYSVDRFEDHEEAPPLSTSRTSGSAVPSKFYEQKGSRPAEQERLSRSPYQRAESDNESDAESILQDRFRRRSTDPGTEDSASSSSASFQSDAEDDSMQDFCPTSLYQRFYLAEEDIVIGVAGYSNCLWKSVAYYLLCLCSFGAAYLVFRWLPRYRVRLMGNPCPLGKADWCVVENEFGELTIVQVGKTRFGERLSHFMTVTQNQESDDPSLQAQDTKEANPVIPYIHSFEYRYIRFFYNPVEDIFKTNSTWYDMHWLNVKNLREGTSQTLYEYRESIFGKNNIEIKEKSNLGLLADEVLHPFYVFQIFSIFLWLADDYYYYAGCIFVISLVSVMNSLFETKATVRRLKEMSKFSCDIRAWRNGFWTQIDSNDLVPGDVFEVDPSMSLVPCDALLINGECVVNESMLTGESVPVSKISATRDTVSYLSENFTHPVLSKSFLYNGTKLLKMKSSNDEPVLAMVLKIGFNTTKGSLVRSMLFPKPTGFKFYEDSFKYIGFMTLIACIGFIYSTYNFIQLGLAKRIMILRALDIITIVVPPALPATLTIGTTFAVNRLKKRNIFCIAPTRVNVGGKLDIVCFDKTGTLTEDGLDILGVHAVKNAEGRKEIVFEDLVDNVKSLAPKTPSESPYGIQSGPQLLGCMASCHSLRLIDDVLVGDPLDVKMFEFTNWHFAEEFGGSSVPMVYESVGKETYGYKILKEYEFVAALRRMSVLADKDDKRYVYTKGAPEVMLDICDPATIPSNFEELLHQYTHGGYRVIACAQKSVSKKINHNGLERESAESDLQFCGFIIFENKLKPSTKGTLQELREAAIRTVMCTGDNVLTAVSVGRECGLIHSSVSQVFIPRFAGEDEQNITGGTGLIWEDIHDANKRLDSVTLHRLSTDTRDIMGEYILAITGDIFRYILAELQQEDLTHAILMRCNIFARMSPDEKHELVEQLQKIDYTVGFCGDGANDCGALKAADVGISLSEAEASVAAPFTSRVFEISCVLDVIKEGRSALVTSFSCFKYMSLYSAIQFITVTLLYKKGTNLGDFQFLYIDLVLILPLAIFMSWSGPYAKLVVKRPTANLVSPKVLVPLVSHIAVILVFQLYVWLSIKKEPWYIAPEPSDDDDHVKSSDNTVLFLFTNFQYILHAVVLSTGPPYRAPLHTNKPFLATVVFCLALSVGIFSIDSESWWGDFMQLTNMSHGAYVMLLLAAAANFFVASYGESALYKKMAQGVKKALFGNRHSKKRFKRLGREMVPVV
ncbi:hypothetical protein CLUG_00654 [Clavispora lusitaniae ATCC 42720]|uniref:Cation-transporting ATPase n=1 Tax=Clavispora lusitaniae (strain ATCC 42720) TaxID=306902 RepID=C4XXI1_CLAL4|nr:uncharacterized protein CLUG_00654 [Clavispora lusitaniae ATCC 42720]EEQ36531.1 hypothetical protein CLUG_00654 [Clavispora lusitaniae ATCC 42720]